MTGASAGIGEQLALALAASGARVVLAARRTDELEHVARACDALAVRYGHLNAPTATAVDRSAATHLSRAIAVPTDVADAASCRALVAAAVDRFGRLDMLVNNAGLAMWARADEVTDPAIYERVMRVTYFGVLHCTLAALPHLKQSRGRIVAVSSLAGRTGVPLRTGYAASKHAVNGFLDSLRIELRESGVSVTIVCPGWVATGAQARNLGADGAILGAMPVVVRGAMTAEECAAITLGAAARRQRELVLGLRARIGLWLKLAFPQVVDAMTARAITGR